MVCISWSIFPAPPYWWSVAFCPMFRKKQGYAHLSTRRKFAASLPVLYQSLSLSVLCYLMTYCKKQDTKCGQDHLILPAFCVLCGMHPVGIWEADLFQSNEKVLKHLRFRTFFGASDVTRTRDLLITSEMHYRLCYTSKYLAQSLY